MVSSWTTTSQHAVDYINLHLTPFRNHQKYHQGKANQTDCNSQESPHSTHQLINHKTSYNCSKFLSFEPSQSWKQMKPENWNPKSWNGKFLALQAIHLFRFQPLNLHGGSVFPQPCYAKDGSIPETPLNPPKKKGEDWKHLWEMLGIIVKGRNNL